MQTENRSLTGLVGDLASDVGTLLRKEVDLAKAEASEKLTDAAVAIGAIVGGVVMALAALIVLLQALVIALTEAGIPAGWSALIVGVAVAAFGYMLVHKGVTDLKAGKLAPRRTMNALEKDAQTIKEQVQ
jgi:hypothetical protein